MKAKKAYVVRDLSGGDTDAPGPKIVKATHASLAEATVQFEHDLEAGRPVLRIEDAKGNVLREA
jgi:hypothetical protein